MIDPDQLPPGFDFHVAHPARVYNVWIGGKDHFAADREAAARVIRHRPQVVDAAMANRQFLSRAVKYLARCQGMRQFLDIGAGLPASGATHEVSQGVDRWSRVVYVDRDPLVMTHARALLTSTDEGCCDYVQADLRDTDYIHREAARTLDMRRPVAVLLVAVLHFVSDADDPPGIVRALIGPLAPGSCVVISHLTADSAPEAVGGAVAEYNALVSAPITARSHTEVTGLLAALRLIAPGVVPVAEWRPDKICGEVTDVYAGVARKAPRRSW